MLFHALLIAQLLAAGAAVPAAGDPDTVPPPPRSRVFLRLGGGRARAPAAPEPATTTPSPRALP